MFENYSKTNFIWPQTTLQFMLISHITPNFFHIKFILKVLIFASRKLSRMKQTKKKNTYKKKKCLFCTKSKQWPVGLILIMTRNAQKKWTQLFSCCYCWKRWRLLNTFSNNYIFPSSLPFSYCSDAKNMCALCLIN